MEETKLTTQQIHHAATNDPALTDEVFTLGDREFKLIYLPWDDHVKFLGHLQPLMEAVASKIAAAKGLVSIDDISVTPLMKYCLSSLPEMVHIMCSQTDPEITVAEVKKLGKSPFKMALLVMRQIQKNETIRDIADFFEQILPVMKAAKGVLKQ